MRAAIYARLSKDRSGQSVNVGIQGAEAREYAAEHDYEVALRADSPCISGSLSLPSLK
jgi:DNA invertase Pin-like site-specific DNA recombinase